MIHKKNFAKLNLITIVFLLLPTIGACAGPAARESAPEVISLKDISYGEDPRQRMDVYLPSKAKGAPVIFMVHGGAWRTGDKSNPAVVKNKVARWVPRGFIFVSTNYRMLPEAAPLEQAEDVALALAVAQAKAMSWGGDPSKFILMGHSAGAHLVALLSADPRRAYRLGAKPWLGSVLLDSAALNVAGLMAARHARLYDAAFGSDPAYWKAASPFDILAPGAAPMLVVCSSLRKDACHQGAAFAAKAQSLNVRADLLPQDLSHRNINLNLGLPGAYTEAVAAFMMALDPSIRMRLKEGAQTPSFDKR